MVPGVERCDPGVTVTFNPPVREVTSGERAAFDHVITVAPGATPGAVLHCTVSFDIGTTGVPIEQLRQEITIHVSPPDRPFVRVDDVTVTATGPEGARVQYRAAAAEPDGDPLPEPPCTPPSGSVFPIGVTVVTCTVSIDGGPPGQDTAVITVLDPAEASRRVWVARVGQLTADAVTFTDQQDISARVGAPCAARGAAGDRAPAWSPDSAKLAFTDSARLCVINADGGGAARPLSTTAQGNRSAADPAWSPDGRDIALSLTPSEGDPTIFVVPSAGGAPVTLIQSIGGAAQPAYQVLPARDLTITVSVGGQPAFVGGAAIPVTFTVRNASPRPATNVFLTPTLPAGLPLAGVDPRCDAAATTCQLGGLGVGDQVTVTVVLRPAAPVVTTVTGRVTGTVNDQPPITRQASAPLAVLAPTLAVDPPIGPPGFVTHALGANFPPGATVRLRWDFGLSARPDTVVVRPDGTFRTQVLILPKDPLGVRTLVAERVTGPTFGAVRAGEPFLVVRHGPVPPFIDDGGGT